MKGWPRRGFVKRKDPVEKELNAIGTKADLRNFHNIPAMSSVKQQQVMDNYFQVKLDIRTLTEREVFRLKMKQEQIDEL